MSRDYTIRICQSRKDRAKIGKKGSPKFFKVLKSVKNYKEKKGK